MRDFTNEIDKSLDLLFKGEEKQGKKKQLIDKSSMVYLQVMLFRIPFTYPRKRKFVKLRHSLHGDDPEICLFVPNQKTGVEYKKTTDELIDFCVDYYTEFLEKHKVKGISTIMPFKQLRSEYGTYDLRRKLVRRFDLFLCKSSLLYDDKFIHSLGKIFKVANKMPLGIPFPKKGVDFDPKLQKNIEKAILMSPFYISRFSDNYSIPVGRVSNTKKELKENLEAVLEQLLKDDIIPGGFKNIRALYIWPSQSKSIPLYISTELPVDMKTPRMKCKKKKVRGVSGELSTQPYKKVFVTPTGEVFVSKLGKGTGKIEKEIESEDNDSFEDDSGDENEEEKKESVKTKIKSVGEEEEETETEDDEEIEEKEARLLEEKRRAEEEEENEEEEEDEDEEEESDIDVKSPQKKEYNGIISKKQKLKRKRRNASESENEDMNMAKKKKSGKAEHKQNVNKAERKMLMKQKKFSLKEKINAKSKTKQKKV